MYFYKTKTKCLVGESEAAHTRLDAKDIVVGREHVERGRGTGIHTRLNLDGNLSVVDAGEVARAGRLVLLGLESEGVGVDAGHGATGVVVVRLDLVEVLTGLLLEAVLAVENELEGLDGTDGGIIGGTLLDEAEGTLGGEEGNTGRLGEGHEAVGVGGIRGVRVEDNIGVRNVGGEVPKLGTGRGGGGGGPHELLDGVVVREADLLGLTRDDGVNTGVLHLLDQVLVTLLGEAATLLGVEVHVVTPDLEGVGVEVRLELVSQVEIDADLVVLERDEGKVETGVAVEEEDQGEEHLALTRGHLTPVSLLGLIEVELGVHAPPTLVVLVDTLTTDGKLSSLDRTLGDPVAVIRGTSDGGEGSLGGELGVHVTDEITVAGNSHGDAAVVGGVTVRRLLDVLHREVGVTLVHSLEEGYLGVASQVHVLGTVSYELHETTGHYESFVLYSKILIWPDTAHAKNRHRSFLCIHQMTTYPDEISENPEEGEILPEEEELFMDDEDVGIDLVDVLTTPEGDTVCSALVSLVQQVQTQNKILIKILGKLA